jgi:hypothetical protein
VVLLIRSDLDLLLDLRQVDVSHGILAVEDLGNLLERGALGLDEDEVDPDELDKIPELEGISISWTWQLTERQRHRE